MVAPVPSPYPPVRTTALVGASSYPRTSRPVIRRLLAAMAEFERSRIIERGHAHLSQQNGAAVLGVPDSGPSGFDQSSVDISGLKNRRYDFFVRGSEALARLLYRGADHFPATLGQEQVLSPRRQSNGQRVGQFPSSTNSLRGQSRASRTSGSTSPPAARNCQLPG